MPRPNEKGHQRTVRRWWPFGLSDGGDCEIRTHGQFPVGSFQDCWFKPLTQVSVAMGAYSSRLTGAYGRVGCATMTKSSTPQAIDQRDGY